MPIISVIVPVYNIENRLHKCVDSILSQTFTNFELILVNDGSLDNSGTICNEYSNRDKRIIVIHQENQGQAVARNNAVKIARGEWLHFVDSDDAIHPQMLDTLYSIVVKTNLKIAMSSAIEDEIIPSDFNNTKKINFNVLKMNEDNFLNLCKNEKYYYWVVWGKLIHKSIYEKNPLIEGRIYEDNAIVCKWLYDAQTVAITDATLYFYYINNDGTTKKAFNEKKFDVLWAFREQIEFFESLGYKKMLNYLCTAFFANSFSLYSQAISENADKNLLKIIKNNEIYIKKHYSNYINFTYDRMLYYYKKTNIIMYYLIRIKRKLGLLR